MAREFQYKTVEEIAALPVYPEPESDAERSSRVQADGGSPSSPGYVYFLSETGGTNYFKIGRSGTPNKRYSDLQTGNPRLLRMNPEFVNNMLRLEQQLHRAMAARYPRGDGGTEWFLAETGGLGPAQQIFMRIINGAHN